MRPNKSENEGLDTLASLCNKASMSNEDHVGEINTGAAPIAGETESPLHNSLDQNANQSIFHAANRINPNILPFMNSLGSRFGPNQVQGLMGSKFCDLNQNSFPQQLLPYFTPNRQPIPSMLSQNSSLGSFSLGYDAALLNSMLLASQQVKTTEQNQNHVRGHVFGAQSHPKGNITFNANNTTNLSSLYVDGAENVSKQSDDKKDSKRLANRKSAQLSRKRKKLFMEELKEENDDLRRKEQILRSIPDLVVVFDATGSIGFASHSVKNVLDLNPNELIGTSFWDKLCQDSVRFLKASFMDALAAHKKDMDTIPLGTGLIEIKLKSKSGNFMRLTLNGVVNFVGETPECVCSIRPINQESEMERNPTTLVSQDNMKQRNDEKHLVAIIDTDSGNSAVSGSSSD